MKLTAVTPAGSSRPTYVEHSLFSASAATKLTDTIQDDRLTLDFTSAYAFDGHWQIYFNAKNLLNTPRCATIRACSNLPIQREFYLTPPSKLARQGALLGAPSCGARATLTIGAGPDAVIYDPKRRLAFIPCGRDGVLEVIAASDARHIAIVQTVTTQLGARTGAVDPTSGALYLPTAQFQPPATPGGGRPAVIPGTFELLVVTPG